MSARYLAVGVVACVLLAGCGQSTAPDGGLEQSEADQTGADRPGQSEPVAKTEIAEEMPTNEVTDSLANAMATPLVFEETAEALTQVCMDRLASAEAQFEALEQFSGTPTIDGFYRSLNAFHVSFTNGIAKAALFENVHPNEEVRKAAETCVQEFDKLGTLAGLSRPIYDALSKIDSGDADGATQFSLRKALRDYRRAGVDKDEATRERVKELSEEITKIGQDFGRNIREDVRHIELGSVDDLKGLPQDYIDAHQPGDDGKIRITTDYPDYIPFMTYAENDQLRKEFRKISRSRAYPQNESVLKNLISKRAELAKLLGYKTFAHYVTEDKMVGSPARAQAFIDEIAGTVKEEAERDKAILLKRLQKIDPAATELGVWQYSYLKELVSKEEYSVDSKALREYFLFQNVRKGIFDLSSDLFGIEIKDWDVPVWDDSVTAHQIWQDGQLIGLFYLDLHPRDGKYKHAAHFGTQDGIAGVQLPISVLVCNFPGDDDPNALMEHSDVVTFLHEFGHLLHAQFAGRGQWMNNSGISTEWDFVEAPSQLLEEWAYDYDTLKTFAFNEAGATIPEELVASLNRARMFGVGIETAIQTFYASMSLAYYNADPASFELLPKMKELQANYAPFPYLEDTHFYASFGHLNGYSAIYYTYQWSLAIATDMFHDFRGPNMRNTDVSKRYRRAILDPGGSKPADDMVETFLGRPFTTQAYKDWLNRGE